ncbi:hypothetical protein EXN66_Car010765 [Channa argus]|uniref:Uncharacterized protein n=1 Tax=Channa argus TaxID=215402 RepID=A0A6G1PXZ0_CHAAH|nr:hypothetical protein EXN66_Car010765 [Channa argus]
MERSEKTEKLWQGVDGMLKNTAAAGFLAGRLALPAAPAGKAPTNTQNTPTQVLLDFPDEQTRIWAQTDGLDVNAPNSDGVTPVMLAVRDIDLFEDIAQQLPWEHRPVEVVKELLGLSADLQIQDHRGRSGLLYASKIDSTLKDEIIHMMVEALHCTALALNTYSYQDLVSFGDLDMELDIKTLYPNQLTGPSTVQTPTHQCDFLVYKHTGAEKCHITM